MSKKTKKYRILSNFTKTRASNGATNGKLVGIEWSEFSPDLNPWRLPGADGKIALLLACMRGRNWFQYRAG
jgi:hypothetical protein